MKWRNQILALLCLTIFIALGFLYFRHWVVQKPFGIVLFVGEGLTPERVAATRLYARGANAHLAIESFLSGLCGARRSRRRNDHGDRGQGQQPQYRNGGGWTEVAHHHRSRARPGPDDWFGNKCPPDGSDIGGVL